MLKYKGKNNNFKVNQLVTPFFLTTILLTSTDSGKTTSFRDQNFSMMILKKCPETEKAVIQQVLPADVFYSSHTTYTPRKQGLK